MLILTLKDYQKQVDDFVNKFEDGYWPPLAMFAALVEEVGEISRAINAIEEIKTLKNKEENGLDLLSEELGDLIFSISCIANYYNISLDESINKSITKYNVRDSNRWKLKSK